MAVTFPYLLLYKVPFLKDIKAIIVAVSVSKMKLRIEFIIFYLIIFNIGPVIEFYIYFDK